MKYSFLVLCVLLAVPAMVIFVLRPDLRRPMGFMAGVSLPFAMTEFLFYPTYWEPEFLFDLPDVIGFGIEDFLFVSALGAFVCGVYPFVRRQAFATRPQQSDPSILLRASLPIGLALLGAMVSYSLDVPVIWSSVAIMYAVALGIWIQRRDLLLPGVTGGVLSAGVYFVLCLILGFLIPDIFELGWHAEAFSNIYVAGVPLEEILYSLGAGTAGSVFYPFVFSKKLVPLNGSSK